MIEGNNYKVLITTSGVGSRLKDTTKHLNKALIEVGGVPVLTRILKTYPQSTRFVITLGYLADQVKNFLSQNHPDKKIEFVHVDNYNGPGSSCGYSMLQAESCLRVPFIFHACDTIVLEPVPPPNINWTAGYVNEHLPELVIEKNFTTHLTRNGRLARVNPLGAKDYKYIHMGITAIKDYKKFWNSLQSLYEKNIYGPNLTDVHVINDLIKKGTSFSVVPFKKWLDTGNPDTLAFARGYLDNTRPKNSDH